jgi:hypothetical protein
LNEKRSEKTVPGIAVEVTQKTIEPKKAKP